MKYQPPKVEFQTKGFVKMLMDCFVDSGQLPHNVRALAESMEWCARLQPAFVPEDPDHFLHQGKVGDGTANTRTYTKSIDQTRLFIGVPGGGGERVYGVTRVYLSCWRTQCDRRGLKWILETDTWFAMICEHCWTMAWQPNGGISRLLRDYLNTLPTLQRLAKKNGWSSDPIFMAQGVEPSAAFSIPSPPAEIVAPAGNDLS